MPNSAVKFYAYESSSVMLQKYLETNYNIPELNAFHRLMCGAGAGIIAMSATYPLEMVRGRLTILNEAMGDRSPYRGILHAAVSIVRSEGPLALYKGWLPSVIGVVPYVGLNFAVYESLKRELLTVYSLESEKDLSIWLRLSCGGIAGSVGQTIAYPLDVVRRRLQVSGWEDGRAAMASLASTPASGTADATTAAASRSASSSLSAEAAATSQGGNVASGKVVQYKGMVDCFKTMVREEGVAALFRGIWPNYLKVVPSIAIAFVVYEQMKEGLGVSLKISSS